MNDDQNTVRIAQEPAAESAPYQDDDYEKRLKAARKRVKEIKEFYSHLASYVFVNILVFFIDIMDGELSWFYWVLIPWGIGLAFHAYNVYAEEGIFGKDWEDRKVREIMGEKRKRDRL